MSRKLNILFLCTGNSCRSQMAEGVGSAAQRRSSRRLVRRRAAGGHGLLVVRAMAEAGVDITNQKLQHVNELGDVSFDYVITVCDHARETCPVFPQATKAVHVGFDDPPRLPADAADDEQTMPHYRRGRDEIRQFVQTLPESLGSPESPG